MSSLPLSSRVGILGGGQLGWMLAIEGKRLGLRFTALASPEEPVCSVADRCLQNPEELVEWADVVTFEFEHVDERAVSLAEEKGKLLPNLKSIQTKRERHREKEFLKSLGVPVPRFRVAKGKEEALRILRDEFNMEAVVKESHGGYDGKGQYYITGDPTPFIQSKTTEEIFVIEELVKYDFEASVIAVSNGKELAIYPPSYNFNSKGILVYNYGPIGLRIPQGMVEKIFNGLDYRGTMGIELFVRGKEILVNEVSPRVHNTGHYTLDGARTSQFENHLRGILGLPLGETRETSYFGTVNILGLPKVPVEVMKEGTVWWYGKRESRKRRKMGHVNVLGDDLEDVKNRVDRVYSYLYGDEGPNL